MRDRPLFLQKIENGYNALTIFASLCVITLNDTKIDVNADKYTFVWNKSVSNYDRIVTEENSIYIDEGLEEKGDDNRVTADQITAVVEIIDRKPIETPKDNVLRKKAGKFKKDVLPCK